MRTKWALLWAVLLTPVVAGSALAQQPSPDALRPGDAIRLQLVVPGDTGTSQDYSGDYMVAETGTVSLPLIGVLPAVNVPAQELRSRIVSEYESLFRNQSVQVTMLRRISVLGAVKSPGLYHADPTMRISDVIATAGGVLPNGKPDEVRIVRDGEEIVADLTPTSSLPQGLRSGDQVFVPERAWIARNFPWLVGLGITITALIVREGR